MTTYCKFLEWAEIGPAAGDRSYWVRWYLEMVDAFVSHYKKDWKVEMAYAFWAMDL